MMDEAFRQQEAEKLAERILAQPELLRFASPETKGRLLRALCQTSWNSMEETQEEAIISILEWTQSQREYREILEHMTLDGSTIHHWEGHRMLSVILDGKEKWQLIEIEFKISARDDFGSQESKIPLVAIANEPIRKRFTA